MTRLTSMPHEADSTTAGLASLMRVASSGAAKPPNTTEWIAPMRAQASIGDRRLGDHRHVDDDAVALADAEVVQDAGERGDLVGQLGVGVGARSSW